MLLFNLSISTSNNRKVLMCEIHEQYHIRKKNTSNTY